MIPEVVARLLSTSALAGTRGSLTLFGLALAARLGVLEQSPSWMTSDVGLGLLLALVILEELAEQDEDLQALFDWAAYALRAGAGVLAAMTVTVQAQAQATGAELALPEWLPSWGPTLIGATVATATHHLRSSLHGQLRGAGDSVLSPRTWLAWLELGGVLGLLVAIVFAPVIALGFVVVASLAGVGVIVTKRALERRVFRRACPACGHRARVEASRCPGCRGSLPIAKWLR